MTCNGQVPRKCAIEVQVPQRMEFDAFDDLLFYCIVPLLYQNSHQNSGNIDWTDCSFRPQSISKSNSQAAVAFIKNSRGPRGTNLLCSSPKKFTQVEKSNNPDKNHQLMSVYIIPEQLGENCCVGDKKRSPTSLYFTTFAFSAMNV